MINFNPIVELVKGSRTIQFVLVFIAGGFIATVLYPTKQIKDTVARTYQQQIQDIKQQASNMASSQQSKYEELQNQYSSYKTQTDSKINELTTQVSDLKTHTKTTIMRTVHPDGTVEENEVQENDTDQSEEMSQQMQSEWQMKTDQAVQTVTQQFQTQISTMQSSWTSKEEQYQQTISTLKETKTVTTNPKSLGVSAGLLTDGGYYGHVSYDVWGPFFIDGLGEFGPHSTAGAGIGIRF
jgi:iron-sulfur cluster repair protein YtfE (RIC family)